MHKHHVLWANDVALTLQRGMGGHIMVVLVVVSVSEYDGSFFLEPYEVLSRHRAEDMDAAVASMDAIAHSEGIPLLENCEVGKPVKWRS